MFLAVPIEVEHEPVERIAFTAQCVDNATSLGFVMIAVFRCDVAQRPKRRQRLAAGKGRELLGGVGHCGRAVYEVEVDRTRVFGDI